MPITSKPLPSVEYLRECLYYHDGELIWRERPREHFATDGARNAWNARYAGKVAGTLKKSGYKVVRIDSCDYNAHRVVWAHQTGKAPVGVIHHKDGNPANNQIENLADVSQAENMKSMRAYSNNTSGFNGVYRHRGKWVAFVSRRMPGFSSEDEARRVYDATYSQMLESLKDCIKEPRSRAKPLPSLEYLNEALWPDKATGNLWWRWRPRSHFNSDGEFYKCNSQFAGKMAGSKDNYGYWRLRLCGKLFRVHRILWYMATGEQPDVIDHINRDKSDNRLCNLTPSSCRENALNRGTDPIKQRDDGSWSTNVRISLGRWDTKEQAIAARQKANEIRIRRKAWGSGVKMYDSIPAELRSLNQWVVTRPGDKCPYSINTCQRASSTNPFDWSTFNAAASAVRVGQWEHLGFVLTRSDPYSCIDLDRTDNPDFLRRQIAIENAANSYSEVSRSGEGLHIFVRAVSPTAIKRSHVEVYSHSRMMIMTGKPYRNIPIADGQELIDKLWAKYGVPQIEMSATMTREATKSDKAILSAVKDHDRNGLTEIAPDTDWATTSFPSGSEADYALIRLIVEQTRDPAQILRVFRLLPLGKRLKNGRLKNMDYTITRVLTKFPPVDNSDVIRAANEALGRLHEQQRLEVERQVAEQRAALTKGRSQ